MLTVIDLQGNHHTALSEVPRVQRVNGERENYALFFTW